MDNVGEVVPYGGDSRNLDVPLYQQPQSSNKCGPTCCRMVLGYFGTYKSLNSIVTEMQNMADSDYTHIDSVTTMLNRYVPGNHYVKTTLSSGSFSIRMMASIDAGYPMICHLKTGALPAYNNANYNHYVVVTGYMWGQGGSSGGTDVVYYNDPHYDSRYYGKRSCRWAEMEKAIANFYGLYVRGI